MRWANSSSSSSELRSDDAMVVPIKLRRAGIQAKTINLVRCSAEQSLLFFLIVGFCHPFKRIPKHPVANEAFVYRKIAFKHAS